MYFSRVRLRPEFIKSTQLNRVLQGNVYGIHQLLYDLFSIQQRTFIFREEIAKAQLSNSSAVRGEPVYYLVSQDKPVEPDNSIFALNVKDYRPQLVAGQKLKFECRVNPVITKNGRKHDVVMDTQLNFLKSAVKDFKSEEMLPVNAKKSDYKKALLEQRGQRLDAYLTNLLADDPRYREQLAQVVTMYEKLDWTIKARIDTALENWFTKQGERCGFQLLPDDYDLLKLQNSAYQWHAIPEKGKTAGFSSVDFTGELQITDVKKFQNTLFCGLGRSKSFGCGLLMIRRM